MYPVRGQVQPIAPGLNTQIIYGAGFWKYKQILSGPQMTTL
jgi:hypothetical protein